MVLTLVPNEIVGNFDGFLIIISLADDMVKQIWPGQWKQFQAYHVSWIMDFQRWWSNQALATLK